MTELRKTNDAMLNGDSRVAVAFVLHTDFSRPANHSGAPSRESTGKTGLEDRKREEISARAAVPGGDL